MSDSNQNLVCDRVQSYCNFSAKIRKFRQIGEEFSSFKQRYLT